MGALPPRRRSLVIVDTWFKDTIDARVYEGIHFRTADEQAAQIGKRVAHWLDKQYFQQVDDEDDDD
jgi:hypothetical protein